MGATKTTSWREITLIIAGLVLFVAGGIVLAIEPNWAISPVGAGAALIAGGLTILITTLNRRRRERREEVVSDERIASINEKAGNRAFQAVFAVEGVTFAVVSFTQFDPPLRTMLGGLFVFTALGYIVAYNYYRSVM